MNMNWSMNSKDVEPIMIVPTEWYVSLDMNGKYFKECNLVSVQIGKDFLKSAR